MTAAAWNGTAAVPAEEVLPGASDSWGAIGAVTVRLRVEIVLPPMSLRSIAALTAGQILISEISASEDLPVQIAGAAIGSARFESVDSRMTLRMTRLN